MPLKGFEQKQWQDEDGSDLHDAGVTGRSLEDTDYIMEVGLKAAGAMVLHVGWERKR